MDKELIKDTAFANNDFLYNKTIEAVPKPKKEVGIDLENGVITNIINSIEDGINSPFDVSAIQNFTNISRNRNDLYQTLDYMAQDSSISAILETYAEDATETNDNGNIVWVESNDGNAAKFITYLLDTLGINKHIYDWTHSLCKYGDLYVRLYRESEYDDFLFGPKEQQEQPEVTFIKDGDEVPVTKKKKLDEDVNIKVYKKSDKYVHYVEKVDNPAQIFELTKFGKTAAYIKTDVEAQTDSTDQMSSYTPFLNSYRFNKNDVTLYQPTEFVHASLQDNTSRNTEEVELFILNEEDKTETNMRYKVKRGQSLLYNSYKVWRQLQLLETSVLLNRITQSSIIRTIGVEVGDMPKEQVGPHLAGIKQLIEQKTALDVGGSLNEYTNPGPIINNIYVPTRNGQGAITASQIGGDVDVKSLADLDYYQNKYYGSFRVPKQYFGVTDDGAGFNGGQSLSIISSRYAKMIKRIQNTMCQMITDMINLILLDTHNESYINNFTIKMLPPTTQEDIDRRENLVSKVGLVSDIMNTLNDIENPITRLHILKSLLSNTITDPEVIQLLEDEINSLEQAAEEQQVETEEGTGLEDDSMFSDDEPLDFGSSGGSSGGSDFGGDFDLFATDETEESSTTETGNESEDTLPSPADLNIGDVSDSTNPELV